MRRWMFSWLLLGGAVTACAQMGEVSLSFGRSLLRNKDLGGITQATATGAPTTIRAEADANFRLTFRFTVNNWRFLGQEFGYGYNRGKLALITTPKQQIGETGMPIHQGFYDLLAYATREGSPVRPFVAGGGHFSTFYPPGTSVFSGNGVTKFGLNYGAGIKVRVSDMFLVRFDVRDYFQGKPDFGLKDLRGWLHLWEATMGLALAF